MSELLQLLEDEAELARTKEQHDLYLEAKARIVQLEAVVERVQERLELSKARSGPVHDARLFDDLFAALEQKETP